MEINKDDLTHRWKEIAIESKGEKENQKTGSAHTHFKRMGSAFTN